MILLWVGHEGVTRLSWTAGFGDPLLELLTASEADTRQTEAKRKG